MEGIKDYVRDRVDNQIAWYDKKSLSCQKKYKTIQLIEIILAAVLPLLAGYTQIHYSIPIIIGLIGVAITILESVTKLYKYHENWIQYRSTCELLKYHKNLYETGSSPYNQEDETIDNIFVRNIEQIISSENNHWKLEESRAVQKEREKDEGENNQPSTHS